MEILKVGSIKTVVDIVQVFKRMEKSAQIFDQSEVAKDISGNAVFSCDN